MKMPRKLTTLAVVLGLLMSITAVASAQEPNSALSTDDLPGSGWYTGVQLQNVGTAQTNVTVESKANTSGGATFTKSDSIAQNGSKTYLPHDLNITGSGFQGSSTVSAGQPMNAIVNLTNRKIAVSGNNYGVDGGLAAAQYQGVNAAATELNFALVKRNHFGKTTTFYIQNAGTAAATATAVFKTGNPVVEKSFTTPSIEPGRMYVLNPAAAGVAEGNNVSLGSLTVTSAQPIAGVVVEHGSENPGVQLQSTRGFTSGDRGEKAFAPIIKSEYFNRFTGLQIQNVGSAAVDLTVTYQGADGPCKGQTFTATKTGVAAGASHTFVHLVGSEGNTMPKGCLASATISTSPAGSAVVAIVNESFVPAFITGGGNGGRQEATTYSAQKGGSTKLSAPLYKENSFSKGTGLQVQNVGTGNANVVVTFTDASGTSYKTKAQVIAAGGAFTFVEMAKKATLFDGTPMPSTISGAAGVFGVIVTSDQPVVAIANESTYPFGNSPVRQDKNNYEAFPIQ